MPYAGLADLVLLLHLGVVCFVVGGLIAVIVGNWRGWHWVNRRSLRMAHLAAIGFVVVQSWLGATCPLTRLEVWLREQARAGSGYQGGFIEYWVGRLLFHDLPGWVFAVVYTVFAGLVVATWWRWPPRRAGSSGAHAP